MISNENNSAISQEIPHQRVNKFSLKQVTYLKFHWNISGANKLSNVGIRILTIVLRYLDYLWKPRILLTPGETLWCYWNPISLEWESSFVLGYITKYQHSIGAEEYTFTYPYMIIMWCIAKDINWNSYTTWVHAESSFYRSTHLYL